MRTILHMRKRLEIFVLCPHYALHRQRGGIHDTVGEREAMTSAEYRGINGKLVVKDDDLTLPHVGEDFRYDVAASLDIEAP